MANKSSVHEKAQKKSSLSSVDPTLFSNDNATPIVKQNVCYIYYIWYHVLYVIIFMYVYIYII